MANRLYSSLDEKRGSGHRVVAVCRTEAGDINAAIVRRGWAVDWPRYSQGTYSREQEAARQEGLGVWSGRFQMPWDWRREHP